MGSRKSNIYCFSEIDLKRVAGFFLLEWKTLVIFAGLGWLIGLALYGVPQRQYKAAAIVKAGSVFASSSDGRNFEAHIRDVILPYVLERAALKGEKIDFGRDDLYLNGFRNDMPLYIKVWHNDMKTASRICDDLAVEIVSYGNKLFDLKYGKIARRIGLYTERLNYLNGLIAQLHAKIPAVNLRDTKDSPALKAVNSVQDLIRFYEREGTVITNKVVFLKYKEFSGVRFEIVKNADTVEASREWTADNNNRLRGVLFLGLWTGVLAVFFRSISRIERT